MNIQLYNLNENLFIHHHSYTNYYIHYQYDRLKIEYT